MNAIENLRDMANRMVPGNVSLTEAILELDARLKAVENAHNGLLTALTADQVLRIDYAKAFHTESSSKPAPVPDLDALVEKYCKLYYENHEMPVPDILRAFAAELVKP